MFTRFLFVGAAAFGGGGAALPLMHQIAVTDTGWLTPEQFALGVACAYATPGPILIVAAFVGFYVAGLAGAVAATAGVFAIPVFLAAGSASVATRLNRYARFRAFGRFAGVAAIGLLMVTMVTLARPVFELHPALVGAAALILAAERCGVSPVLLLTIAVVLGAMVGAVASS